jgi:Tfp pilus assembly protein FimT
VRHGQGETTGRCGVPSPPAGPGSRRCPERGVSLPEILATIAVAALVVGTAAAMSVHWLGREDNRSAVYTLRTQMQIARVQAVSRNRACRLLLDTSSRRVRILDLNDPANSTDDLLLAETTLSTKIQFASPTGGPPVTLAAVSGTVYQATFAPDGSVPAGAGAICLLGGDRYNRITLLGAGGTKFERWDGNAWVQGS